MFFAPNAFITFFPAMAVQILLFSGAVQSSSRIDSAETLYSIAARNYDRVSLELTSEFLSSLPADEQRKPRSLLIGGLTHWRLELIAYCSNSVADMNRYGKSAIELLNKAEKAGADHYLTASHKALACQLLAGQSIGNGAIYGPRAAAELKKARTINPQGYFSRLVEAINANQAPSFAGGNPEKAAASLEQLASDFPDSIDVKIHLSDAYKKTGRTDDAFRLIVPVIQVFPSNLLARKIAAGLPAR